MSQFTTESSSVQNYLNSIQAVINRMAANSASCKTWCITLISAVVVFATDKTKPEAIWVSLIPLGLFLILDAYYLGLERKFRALYNEFVGKLHREEVVLADIYNMKPPSAPNTIVETVRAITSISVWPFYVFTTTLLIVLRSWIF